MPGDTPSHEHSHLGGSASPSDFKTEFHPQSKKAPLFQSYEEFRHYSSQQQPLFEEPWQPFSCHGDFEFAEIVLEAGLNKAQINGLLSLIARISEGSAKVTFKNDSDLHCAWNCAAMQLTPVCIISLHTNLQVTK
jgi:hypothetical protein